MGSGRCYGAQGKSANHVARGPVLRRIRAELETQYFETSWLQLGLVDATRSKLRGYQSYIPRSHKDHKFRQANLHLVTHKIFKLNLTALSAEAETCITVTANILRAATSANISSLCFASAGHNAICPRGPVFASRSFVS